MWLRFFKKWAIYIIIIHIFLAFVQIIPVRTQLLKELSIF